MENSVRLCLVCKLKKPYHCFETFNYKSHFVCELCEKYEILKDVIKTNQRGLEILEKEMKDEQEKYEDN